MWVVVVVEKTPQTMRWPICPWYRPIPYQDPAYSASLALPELWERLLAWVWVVLVV